MGELFDKLLELQHITTDVEIKNFIENNKMDIELISTIGFIINKLDITNIDIKKLYKFYFIYQKYFK